MKTDKRTLSVALLLTLALGGCSLAPGFNRPMAPVAAVLPGTTVAGQPGVQAADLGWREFFADPRLQTIIEMALANNRDLRETALNVEAFQAQYACKADPGFTLAFSRARVLRIFTRLSAGCSAALANP